jgi:hypothetical protein
MNFFIKIFSVAFISLSVTSINIYGLITTKNSSTPFNVYERNAKKRAELSRTTNLISFLSGTVAMLLWANYTNEQIRQDTNFGRINKGFFLRLFECWLIAELVDCASSFTLDCLWGMVYDFPEDMVETVQTDLTTRIIECNDTINAIEKISSVKNDSPRAENLMHYNTILKHLNQSIASYKETAMREKDTVILAKADELQEKIVILMKSLNDEIVILQELQNNETPALHN